MIFLLQYDRSKGRLVRISEFAAAEVEEASVARLALELELLRDRVEHEVVLLQADSETALRKTHNRYFKDIEELANTVSR